MKYVRELLIVVLLCLIVYLFFRLKQSNDHIDNVRKAHDEKEQRWRHQRDSIIQIKNEYAKDALGQRTEINTLRVENKFLKNIIKQGEAAYEKDKHTRAPHIADSAIIRAWADLYSN